MTIIAMDSKDSILPTSGPVNVEAEGHLFLFENNLSILVR